MILASQSPRRKELLARVIPDFKIEPAAINEEKKSQETPEAYVLRMAEEKAGKLSKKYPTELILASDTVVVLENKVLGKPQDEQEAFIMLQALSGKTHEVLTSVCLQEGAKKALHVVKCAVTFYPLTTEEIKTYIATKEPMDKAGSYGIQGQGALLVEKINGDYYAVMGLPIATVKRMLANF